MTRSGNVVCVEANGFGDPSTSVERETGQGPVARGRVGLRRTQPAQLGGPIEEPGRFAGNGGSFDGGPTHAAASVEVVYGGQGVVDSGRGLVGGRDEIGAPVTYPGEVLAGLGGVRATGLARQRRGTQLGGVGGVGSRQPHRQRDG